MLQEKCRGQVGKPDALKGACPVWGGLWEDRVVKATYGVHLLMYLDVTFEIVVPALSACRTDQTTEVSAG